MPVRKTRKQRKTRRNSSRRSLSVRRYQRGGADDCNSIGKMRIPGYPDCKFWYDLITRSVLGALYPTNANEIYYRVLAAVHQWRHYKIMKQGANQSDVDNRIIEHFAQGWPDEIKSTVADYLEAIETDDYEALGYLMDKIDEVKKTRPTYATTAAAPSVVAAAPSVVAAAPSVVAAAPSVVAAAPSVVAAAPSVVRSEEPIVRALNYSESADDLQIPPASANTKEKLLAWIAEAKYADIHDPITLEKWSDMTKEELQQTVRTQEGRVYTTASLEGIFRTAMEADTQARNAMSRKPLTRKNARALRNVMRQTNPAYELPSRTQQRPPKHMGFSVAETADGAFYQLSLIDSRDGTELGDLGFVPTNVDESVSGSADVTSAVAIATLQRAWESGKFLSSYRRPFECCRFHLGKTREFWTSPGGTPVDRLEAMIEEVKSVL